jgi:hypothetical protein
MKENRSMILIIVVVIIAFAAGTIFLAKKSSKDPEIAKIPAKSIVSVPEPDATEIETIATYNIPTTARAGSQSHAIYMSYSTTEAKGYLTYEAAPDNPASFTAKKDSKGKWQVNTYKVLGKTNL